MSNFSLFCQNPFWYKTEKNRKQSSHKGLPSGQRFAVFRQTLTQVVQRREEEGGEREREKSHTVSPTKKRLKEEKSDEVNKHDGVCRVVEGGGGGGGVYMQSLTDRRRDRGVGVGGQ